MSRRWPVHYLIAPMMAGGLQSLSIRPVSDLNFGVAVQGDGARTIAPGISEDGRNASFEVQGDGHRAYTILLPADTVTLQGDAGGTMTLGRFASYPFGGDGLLDGGGRQRIFVGATRSALSPSQPSGAYHGSFIVTVIY